MEISGTNTAVQIFPADTADGSGSGSPPLGLTLPLTTLSALGFPAFSQFDPTITFVLADNLYTDNSGHFNLAPVPEPTTVGVVGFLVCAQRRGSLKVCLCPSPVIKCPRIICGRDLRRWL
jgi:hypothetical protein